MSNDWKTFRISPQKSAWSCETNMFSAIDQATRYTMRGGESSKSRFVRLEDCLPSPSSPRLGITRLTTRNLRRPLSSMIILAMMVCAGALFLASPAFSQIPITPPPPPKQNTTASQENARIITKINLVVLHTTVLDDRQRFADGL